MSEQIPYDVEPSVEQRKTKTDSESGQRSIAEVCEMLRPTRSVDDLGPRVHVNVHMHPDVVEAYSKLAERRSPNTQSQYRHETGLACEVATAARLWAQVNREIYPDFEGDSGYDFVIPRPGGTGQARVEVRGTRNWDNPERVIGTDEIDEADRFVLCRTRDPKHYVEIIGSASRIQVKYLGQTYGREGYCLRPDYLSPLGPHRISETELKEIIRELHL